jgi:hypothetical protein
MDVERDLMSLHIATLFTEDDGGRLVIAPEFGNASRPRP